ncbi:uncharacterized protein LOC143893118 [Tasmannia lanceolata]|uniref:uncharacterized protein LOC143893118 n=1 Tax=Tasmannia lanceolata TaxID=3420 RepID=UPI0040640DBA
MGFFIEEEEYWKCQKHPYQSRNGVCPVCLRNRLSLLCPDCANVRPCHSCPSTSSSSSSSSSSVDPTESGTGVGSVGRISFLLDSEPAFDRSKSTAVPSLRQTTGEKVAEIWPLDQPENRRSRSTSSFFTRLFKAEKTKKKVEEEGKKNMKLPRSRSVAFVCYSDPAKISGGDDVRSKGKIWPFPSPIKVFRLPKSSSKIVHDRPPLWVGA